MSVQFLYFETASCGYRITAAFSIQITPPDNYPFCTILDTLAYSLFHTAVFTGFTVKGG